MAETKVVVDISQKGNLKSSLDDSTKSVKALNDSFSNATKDMISQEESLQKKIKERNNLQSRSRSNSNLNSNFSFPGSQGNQSGPVIEKNSGASGLSGLSKFAGPIAAVVKGLETFQKGLDFATKAINTYGDSTKTSAQKNEAFRESLPVFGSYLKSIREFGEALSGLSDKLRKIKDSTELNIAKIEARRQPDLDTQSKKSELISSQARLKSLKNISLPDAPKGDRGTIEYEDQVKVYEAKKNVAYVQAEKDAAQEVKNKARNLHTNKSAKVYNLINERRDQLGDLNSEIRKENRGSKGSNKEAIQAEISLLQEKDKKIQTAIQEEKQARSQAEAKSIENQQIGLKLEQAKLDLIKSELSAEKSRGDRLGSQAERLGSATKSEKNRLLRFSSKIQKNIKAGKAAYAGSSKSQRELYNRLNPEKGRKFTQEFYEKSKYLNKFNQYPGQYETGTLADSHKKQGDLEGQVAEKELSAKVDFETRIQKSLSEFVKIFEAAAKVAGEQAVRELNLKKAQDRR